ncbi:hypothetical protein [Desulfitobacterium chlororespirans]|uniref:Uncharacterized protein n=1 Tax=Desulfitobacterium chlororespirans DSM 11544 TaxID=1121395 RepID=A0A1M7UB84_9FIRM|nr:hypothetical protein [Desulfitobacterium chlororespirans]SHN80214.1 hypothetical protein SAMN02745215_03366 [Desulfitobacterium chlororespirans DSM 11544]
MKITEEDILNAKKAYDHKEEIEDETLAVLYAKALTRNSKRFPDIPQKVKYVALKLKSGKFVVEWRGSETCTADGRP